MTLCDGAAFQRWINEIGDPGLLPWVAVFLYLGAAWASGRATRRARSNAERIFWIGVSTVAFLLAVNKQLDIQTLVMRCGRVAAKTAELGADRRLAQKIAAIALAVGATMLFAWLLLSMKKLDQAMRVTLAGGGLVALYILSRSGSILHLPALSPLLPRLLRALIETLGAMLMLLGALRAARRSPDGPADHADRR